MGNSKLSQTLLSIGFFSALGTTEGQSIVKRGAPFTMDQNNGVLVVYDEAGRPWIYNGSYEVAMALSDFPLKRGAYVPHSNDGGHFVRDIMAKL